VTGRNHVIALRDFCLLVLERRRLPYEPIGYGGYSRRSSQNRRSANGGPADWTRQWRRLVKRHN
jgi:hypothetical protein